MQEFKKYFAPVAVGIVVLWVSWGIGVWLFGNNWSERGQLGDLFGGVNALFSGLALAGVVTAVILQSHELQLQRKELEQTRQQLQKTAEANQKAAEALNAQIGMQLQAAELTTVSTLLASVNSQLGTGMTPRGDSLGTLAKARAAYHQRLHEVLNTMGRGVPLPIDCKSVETPCPTQNPESTAAV